MNTTTTQTDRELLELAAKAAGHTLHWSQDGTLCWLDRPWDGLPNNDGPWSPRHNDGDALRLAVHLNFTVSVCSHEVEVFTDEGECTSTAFAYGEDKGSIVRRAIVRAAAEVGREML